MKKIGKYVLSLLFLTQMLATHAENHSTSPVESLPTELRHLLIEEMRSIQKGMLEIIPALASGDTKKIVNIAKEMENSYVLTRSLSDEQKRELRNTLPPGFFILDGRFHYYSGMLAHVSSNNKTELINFYFGKLAESCANCHSQYAQHTFPNFVKSEPAAPHSH
jgi:hypothetical protein